MKRRWYQFRKRRVALALAAALLGGLGYFRLAYPGCWAALGNEWPYATWDESQNLAGCIRYWLATMGQLEFDEATGLYGFEKTDVSRWGPFERGKREYHRGRFADAIGLIEDDIDRGGETADKLFWLAMAHLREAEVENCLARLNGPPAPGQAECCGPACSLPLSQPHGLDSHSRRAAQLLERLLDNYS